VWFIVDGRPGYPGSIQSKGMKPKD
jgi:hypothetical protein